MGKKHPHVEYHPLEVGAPCIRNPKPCLCSCLTSLRGAPRIISANWNLRQISKLLMNVTAGGAAKNVESIQGTHHLMPASLRLSPGATVKVAKAEKHRLMGQQLTPSTERYYEVSWI